jgi:predicted  nucleic acid-binding Zn-ribbon protein
VNTYVRKESKFVQTELGKYAYMDEIEGAGGRREDRYLERELKDAEQLIQMQKGDKAEYSQEVLQLELELKKVRMQKDAARHDARNAEATNERMTEKLKQQMHDLNKYKIETEALIEQIDMADAKTREAEDKLAL